MEKFPIPSPGWTTKKTQFINNACRSKVPAQEGFLASVHEQHDTGTKTFFSSEFEKETRAPTTQKNRQDVLNKGTSTLSKFI